jgi:hypothetical protein
VTVRFADISEIGYHICFNLDTLKIDSFFLTILQQLYATEVGNFWEIRPLTDEMIAYASGDVTALIPEVYETQKE